MCSRCRGFERLLLHGKDARRRLLRLGNTRNNELLRGRYHTRPGRLFMHAIGPGFTDGDAADFAHRAGHASSPGDAGDSAANRPMRSGLFNSSFRPRAASGGSGSRSLLRLADLIVPGCAPVFLRACPFDFLHDCSFPQISQENFHVVPGTATCRALRTGTCHERGRLLRRRLPGELRSLLLRDLRLRLLRDGRLHRRLRLHVRLLCRWPLRVRGIKSRYEIGRSVT
jgi:hypothetical protein